MNENMSSEIITFGELCPVQNEVDGQWVDARNLHKLLKSGQHFANWIVNRIEKYGFIEGVDYKKFNNSSIINLLSDKPEMQKRIDYIVTIDMAKQLAMVENNEAGLLARKYFIACEKKLQSILPKDYVSALRALADAEEKRLEAEKERELAQNTAQAAIAERDYYKRTKAEINDRKVATAMNTASVAVRQRDKMADELGNGKKWKEVKAIPWLLDVFEPCKATYIQVGKRLAAMSVEMGYEVRRKETSEYPNGIGIYHIDVIDAFHARLLANPEMLGKYRIDD